MINGRAPTFSDLPGGDVPRRGHRRRTARQARPVRRHLLLVRVLHPVRLLPRHPTLGVDVTSNSYGSSNVDNDGWDAASQEADVIHAGRRTTPLFSTGNGAPGFGTIAPPEPVGRHRRRRLDPVRRHRLGLDRQHQPDRRRRRDGVVEPRARRQRHARASTSSPTARTRPVTSRSTPILDGRNAWDDLGRHQPLDARSPPARPRSSTRRGGRSNGATVPPNFYRTAKDILKSSAEDLGYDAIDPGRRLASTPAPRCRPRRHAAAGCRPNEWRVGDYRGTEYPVFSHVIAPGGADTQRSRSAGPGRGGEPTVSWSAPTPRRFAFTSEPIAQESVYNFNAPDYLLRPDRCGDGPSRRRSDGRARQLRRASQFDRDGDYVQNQAWRAAHLQLDRRQRRREPVDRHAARDGVVDHTTCATISNPDGNLDLDFTRVGDGPGRVRAVHVPPGRRQRTS